MNKTVAIHFIQSFRILFLLTAPLIGLHSLLRLLFFLYNLPLFPHLNAGQLIAVFGWGLKMDASSIVLLNAPFYLLFLVSQHLQTKYRLFSRLAFALFVALNTAGFAINILDIAYFRFNKNRSNADLLYVLRDSLGSYKTLVSGYWPLIMLVILLGTVLYYISKKIYSLKPTLSRWSLLLAGQCLVLAFLFLLARGWEARPLTPASPLLEIDAPYLPLAQNSIESFLYSLWHKQSALSEKKYFSQEALDGIIRSQHFLGTGSFETMIKKNVVICILESFSRCYLQPGNRLKAKTPFFDSLIRHSIYFPNGYANGFTSNQGIVAILAGLPGLLDEPFYYSPYANTPLHSVGNILKEKGYSTHFFLGAGRDHFGFGKFTKMAGIDHYYSRSDFNDDRYDDGNWGIYDGPFLQYGAQVLAGKAQPFFSVFFTISSHPPFRIPDSLQARFNFPGQTPAQRSISYVDDCFRQFFETCQKAAWFKNSLFVFCADHWLYPEDGTGYNAINTSSIPIFIYDPSAMHGSVDSSMISQVDLCPAILQLLGYHGSYTGFGKSPFYPGPGQDYVINKPGYIPQVITRDYVLGYDPGREKSQYLYRYPTDSLCKKNLINELPYDSVRKKLERLVKANIQAYHHALLKRSLE